MSNGNLKKEHIMINLVTLNKNNQPTTTSKNIADIFGKNHSHVLRDIQNLNIPEYFRKSNFGLSSFSAGTRKYPMYEITRDGFTILAMGFTGKKAMEWKIKYIEAFNRMEATVREIRTLPVDMKAIGGMVKRCVNKALTDFLNNELPVPDEDDILRQKYYNVSDKDMAETLQRWYWSRNYDVRQALDRSAQRIEELETKLRMVQKAIS